MRFTVLWREEVQDDLAQLWLDASNRQRLTVAADSIDAELMHDAHLKGLDIGEDRRVLRCPPLVAHFRIDVDDRKVLVEAIDLEAD
ncbi:MAG: hypothetical protein AB7G28_23250 [Pirellulales bacterium]